MKPESLHLPFEDSVNGQESTLPDAELIYYQNYFSLTESDEFFDLILKDTDWKQEAVTIYGQLRSLPRLTAWYGEPEAVYKYSNLKLQPAPWTPSLLTIKTRIEEPAGISFNSVLLNYYRSGQDSVSWHSDDEPELRAVPIIASVSFGSTRTFQLRHKFNKTLKTSIPLEHGSLLLMKGTTQQFWQHQIPKTAKPAGERINLTFRVISSSS